MSVSGVVTALGERPAFAVGETIGVADRTPIGHYRVPTYLRGKRGIIVEVIEPAAVDNEEEGYGRNAGMRRHYYSVAFAMAEVWADYEGSPGDKLQIEVFESWLERI
jgi:nitrile hydratase